MFPLAVTGSITEGNLGTGNGGVSAYLKCCSNEAPLVPYSGTASSTSVEDSVEHSSEQERKKTIRENLSA